MELHDIDDLPFHQHPAPFSMLATSDPHFNDGYFFAFYSSDWYFVTGLRLDPNTNTMDGFAAVTHAGEQRCLRASRALRPRYTELAVGPLRLDITTTPTPRQRVVVNDNEGQFGSTSASSRRHRCSWRRATSTSSTDASSTTSCATPRSVARPEPPTTPARRSRSTRGLDSATTPGVCGHAWAGNGPPRDSFLGRGGLALEAQAKAHASPGPAGLRA